VLAAAGGILSRRDNTDHESDAKESDALAIFDMEATAYSLDGKTKAGVRAQPGMVAADPRVLPLGTRIRVLLGEADLGEFVVTDTGRSIRGKEIDVYIRKDSAAAKFGRKKVVVEVLEWGTGAASAREEVAEGQR
jgi:3D (Asp-Asp-Asp) domain-containing protein